MGEYMDDFPRGTDYDTIVAWFRERFRERGTPVSADEFVRAAVRVGRNNARRC